jgi:N6-L-threonylcarbamoyladenine synthase
LLVGWHFARALALAWGLPCLGVHHIEGHILANHLEADLRYPALVLVVSGGHSQIILMREPGVYELLATTRDDAAGEAFDKVAKLLGLGFPGGPAIEHRARRGDPKAIAFPRTRLGDGGLDFSFSGLKTAARLRWEAAPPLGEAALDDFCASFQRAVVAQLLDRLERAARGRDLAALCLAGGVAANGCLRDGTEALAVSLGLPLLAPAPRYCTDNGAMIACAGALRLAAGIAPPGSPSPEPFSRGVIRSWR